MPHVNGNFYRQAGQGYAAEKGKMDAGPKKESQPAIEGEHSSKGSVVHVKHHGGGKFSVKHEDGQVSQHEGLDDLHQHMAEHFGVHEGGESSGEEDGEDYGMGGEDPLKSILG